MVDQSAGRLLIVDENTYADLLLGTGSASIQNQFQFSALLQQLDQLMRTGTADTVCTMMQTTFFDAAEPPQLDSEQQLLLFTLLLNVRREIFAEQLGEEPARDTACFDLFNAYLRSGAATQLEMLHRFTDLCAETCRQREENETHSTQAIIKRINRYIEDNVENYDLSLTALARMTGFKPIVSVPLLPHQYRQKAFRPDRRGQIAAREEIDRPRGTGQKCGRTYRFCLAVGVHPVLQTQHWGNAEAVF